MSSIHGRIVSAAELIDLSLPEPRWAVPGLLPEGFNLLVGKPKMGKSWMALAVALAVASGGEVFGSITAEAGEVLYLALEDTLRRLQDRLKKVLGKETVPHGLHMVTEWPRLPGGLGALETWLSEHPDCRLVVIDTLTRLRPPRIRGADSYEEDGTLGSMLQSLAHKYHVAIVAIHHSRKAKAFDLTDAVLGSTGLTGAADSIAVLTRKGRPPETTLTITGRDIDERELQLSFDEATCKWLECESGGSMLTLERKAILEVLSKSRMPMTPKDIATACRSSHDSVRHLIRKLHDDGLVIRKEGGLYVIKESLYTS